jgi:Tfp pilus assembly protein PilX
MGMKTARETPPTVGGHPDRNDGGGWDHQSFDGHRHLDYHTEACTKLKNSDQKIQVLVRGDEGVILGVAMIMLLLLTMLGILVTSLSATNVQSGAYEKMSTQSFSGAESGLTQARSDMQSFVVAAPQIGQWPAADSTLVTGVMGGLSQKSYNLTVQGQPVKFAYSITDFGANNDRTVLVTSTGTFRNVQQRIEAVLRYEPPSQNGSQECYSSQCASVDQNSGNNVTNRFNSQASM